ncbi:TonB-dependent receptor plug domain-containing protein [Oleiharenicola lentus]|uniref:TonB-dependent receptor plug domain-containing protein n=1 Tax=Oleiharenicola lentus TaxID=2508720 RepID=UPI003F666101
MISNPGRSRLRLFLHTVTVAALVFGLPALHAQTTTPTPQPPANSTGTKPVAPLDPTLELSPFVVKADPDDSYGALNSNSITNFNAELGKMPISADVFTSAFMEDTNSATLEQMLSTYAAGAGIGSAGGDVSGSPVNKPMDRGGGDSVSAGIQLRGLGAAVVKQDGFMLPSAAGTGLNSNFGIERVEVINGPQSLLYGNGGGGGVINMIAKQARLGRRAEGSLKLQIDEYGHYLGQFDYTTGTRKVAFAVSLMKRELGDDRKWIGGPLEGAYLQMAFKPFANTLVRATVKQTQFNRFLQANLTLNAGSTAIDARHGLNLFLLLATDQIEKATSGPSGAGVIANGYLNWENYNSYAGAFREEVTRARLASVTTETTWKRWLATQLSLGYQDKDSRMSFGSGATFWSPNASSNPIPGEWTMGAGGTGGSAWANQPSDSRSLRFSVVLTNDLFGGRGRSQTITGVDYTKGNYANENYAYYQADANYDLVRNAAGNRIRMALPNPTWIVTNGPVKYPFFPVATQKITYRGVNYAGDVMNVTDPALVSPQNPQGVTGDDLFTHSRSISSGVFAVNFTQWNDGRLTTLAGVRYGRSDSRQLAGDAVPEINAQASRVNFSVGANYALNSWLRPYVTLSDTNNIPAILLTVPTDPLENPAGIAHSVGYEVGLKIGDERGRVSGSLAAYVVDSTNEPYNISTSVRDSINPSGINGRFRAAAGTVISVDRRSEGLQLAVTARPVSNWRSRLSAAFIKGTINSNTSYAPQYNDAFNANAAGQVTYANGTIVYVRPTYLATPGTVANAGYIPLTIAALSDPTNVYYANPDPESGLLRASNGRTILLYIHPANGAIRTGVAGRPISEMQIRGVTPPDQIVTSRAGDRTTGYPEISLSFTNTYSFREGKLKGLRVGGTASLAWRNADYYYYANGYAPNRERELYVRPNKALFELMLGYERKLTRKLTWSTQINVTNIFDDYDILLRPNTLTGYNGTPSAVYSNQPREVTWSNTLKF